MTSLEDEAKRFRILQRLNRIPNERTRRFMAIILAMCEGHGISISHDQDGFILKDYSEELEEKLSRARDETTIGEP